MCIIVVTVLTGLEKVKTDKYK